MHLYPKRALLDGFATEILILLAFGATPEQWSEWLRAPLEHAAARGNFDLVTRLLEAGANGGAGWRGCRGRTLLDAAALGGNPDVVTALLRAGCRPDVKVVSMASRRSALHVSVVCGHKAASRRLVLAGADVNYTDPADHCGPLHVAAAGAHDDVATDLLIAGADPNRGDVNGRAPLHVAAELGHAKVASVLLDNAADVDVTNNKGSTPLSLASSNGHLSTVEVILAAGADTTFRCQRQYSALDKAARNGHADVVKVILKHGADAREGNRKGFTALHYAAYSNQATIDALLDAGADIDAKVGEHYSPLHLATGCRSVNPLVALLRRGADVNSQCANGWTPLHFACTMHMPGLEHVVDVLLRWGASETIVDNRGQTPADMLGCSLLTPPRPGAARLERARVLLSRAPADRSWRSRCWLVMLRSRAERERMDGIDGNCSNQTEEGRSGNKAGRTDAGVSVGSATGGGVLCNGAHGNGAAAAGGLRGWVAALMELESEAVFRTIVGYL